MKNNFKELLKLSNNIYNISSILFEYCKSKRDDDELVKICPILNLLHKEADNLNFKMSEIME